MSAAPILTFRDVAYVVNGARIADRLSFSLGAGERLAVVGVNGCGKSSLARLAAGLLVPSEGRVALFGEDLARLDAQRLRALRARLGLVLQGGSLFGSLSVEDNLRLALGPGHGLDGEDRRIDRLLIGFGLEQAFGRAADTLSTGQRRRLELARAFARDPDLLILDEPLEGADAASAEDLEAHLVVLMRRRPRGLLLTTYDEAFARRLGARVLHLRAGALATA